ncbi:hypothetical protein HDU99_008167, partial [Rhizoclosmatium hyalinum]
MASFQLTFSLSQAVLKLQLFDNDVEIASASGKGVATIHAVNLVQVIEETISPATAPAGGKGDKKDKEKEAKEKEEKERLAKESAAAVAAALGEKPLPKHRYVLQATIQPLDQMKPTSPNVQAAVSDANRPTSRGGKPAPSSASPSKAKKKQSAGPGAVEATSPAGPVEPIWMWKLRVISTDTTSLIVVKDTEKEDRYKMIKDSWEANQPGRAAKARESRDQYLRLTESGTIKPVVIMMTPPAEENPPPVIGKPKEIVVTAVG